MPIPDGPFRKGPGRLVLAFILLTASSVSGQVRMGSIAGQVSDPGGGAIAASRVEAVDLTSGLRRLSVTDADGRFSIAPVPYGRYQVHVFAPAGLADGQVEALVASNVPTPVHIRLSMARFDAAATVVGMPPVDAAPSTRSEWALNDRRAVLPVNRATTLSALVSNAPGVARAHNSLVHVRGVEDGILYVIDGVPVTERYDLLHASAIDVDAIDSLSLLTGNLPAEFGGRNGAVVSIDRSPDHRPFGYARTGGGTEDTLDAAGGGGLVAGRVHISASGAAASSSRMLDPVAEENLHNQGSRLAGAVHADWHASDRHRFTFAAGAARTRIEVPNDLEQAAAGQDANQRLDDENARAGWQLVASAGTVIDATAFHRRYASQLSPSAFDVPLTAASDRSHARTGMVGSVSHQRGRHLIKAGLEASRIAPDERFTFVITDEEMAEERDVSEPALEFDRDNPFVFSGSRVGSYTAAFIQDEVSFGRVRIDGGLRVERATLPAPATQVSPRLGAAMTFPSSGTVLRASFNRLFMPPHVEHLLLANSAEARALSPFAAEETGGGAEVRPERLTSFEAGVAQELGSGFSLDAAYWDRWFTDVADPNVFFNTTIVFPNSVAAGHARGLDLRLTLRESHGVSGFANYTHARVENEGPITGGLFLTDEFLEIGPGTVFNPDHDQPHLFGAGLRWQPGEARWWMALDVRHGGGGPLEGEEDDLEDVLEGPGGDLIDAAAGRMKPWTTVDVAAWVDVWSGRRGLLTLRADVQNVLGSRFAYTVGNPFEGTKFGPPRMLRVGLEWRSSER